MLPKVSLPCISSTYYEDNARTCEIAMTLLHWWLNYLFYLILFETSKVSVELTIWFTSNSFISFRTSGGRRSGRLKPLLSLASICSSKYLICAQLRCLWMASYIVHSIYFNIYLPPSQDFCKIFRFWWTSQANGRGVIVFQINDRQFNLVPTFTSIFILVPKIYFLSI